MAKSTFQYQKIGGKNALIATTTNCDKCIGNENLFFLSSNSIFSYVDKLKRPVTLEKTFINPENNFRKQKTYRKC